MILLFMESKAATNSFLKSSCELKFLNPMGAPERVAIKADRRDFNCYAYALGLPDIGCVIPGGLANRDDEILKQKIRSPETLRQRLLKDGLLEVSETDVDFDNRHIVTAVYSASRGFHVYRNNSDGTMTSKEGLDSISVLNKWANLFRKIAGLPAAVIKSEDFLKKDDDVFVGFFEVPQTGLPYDPRFRRSIASAVDYEIERAMENLFD